LNTVKYINYNYLSNIFLEMSAQASPTKYTHLSYADVVHFGKLAGWANDAIDRQWYRPQPESFWDCVEAGYLAHTLATFPGVDEEEARRIATQRIFQECA
jgi:hypothetical protein